MIDRLQNHVAAAGTLRSGITRPPSGGLAKALPPAATEPAGQVGEDRRELPEADQQQVKKLKQRDREVRAHEQAHMSAGAGIVRGGASFSFQRGPDGQMYAVGGEVKIDTSAETDPDRTIRKMQQVKRAALAPAEPSGTDRAVAAQAGKVEAQARQEKIKLEKAETREAEKEDGIQAPGVAPGRRPYSADAVGLRLDIAV